MSKNAVDEFLGMKKVAFGKGFGQHVGMAASGALAGGLGAAAAGGIGMAVSKIVDAATKSHDFKEMLAANSDLHEHYQADPKKFNMMFSTLRTMNPQFSKDPLVAGAFMRRMALSPEGIGGIATEALGAHGDFENPLQEMFTGGAREGAKSGLTESMKRQGQPDPWEFEKKKQEFGHNLRQQAKAEDEGKNEYTETYEGESDQPNKVQVKFRR